MGVCQIAWSKWEATAELKRAVIGTQRILLCVWGRQTLCSLNVFCWVQSRLCPPLSSPMRISQVSSFSASAWRNSGATAFTFNNKNIGLLFWMRNKPSGSCRSPFLGFETPLTLQLWTDAPVQEILHHAICFPYFWTTSGILVLTLRPFRRLSTHWIQTCWTQTTAFISMPPHLRISSSKILKIRCL